MSTPAAQAVRQVRPQIILAELLHDIAAGKTTPARGQDVTRQTLRVLRAESRGTRERAALDALARRLSPSKGALAMPAAKEDTLRRLQRLCARQPGAREPHHGLARSYRRTRKLGKRASLQSAAPGLMHRWRKRVKYLYYQVRLADMTLDRAATRWRRCLDELGTVPGELQDLTVFAQRLAQLDDPDAKLALARRPLERARQHRTARLGKLQRRCFARRRAPFPA